MNEPLKIGVVEDEPMTAQLICNKLNTLGYKTVGIANSYAKALKMIRLKRPDILLIDIFLKGKKDGIELAKTLNELFDIPFIFLTSNDNKEVFDRAKRVNPMAYLMKPFKSSDLKSAIEICSTNFSKKQALKSVKSQGSYLLNESVFIKDGTFFQKVSLKDICYIVGLNESQISIHLLTKQITLNVAFDDCIDNLSPEIFCRINRNTLLNIDFIETITPDHVVVNNEKIPTSRKYIDEILMKFQIL